jgi:hypothetical protein
MRIASYKDFAAGLLYISGGSAAAIASYSFALGTPRDMGPGFFPLIASTLLVVTGFVVLVSSLISRAEIDRIGAWAARPVLALTVGVILFATALKPLGIVFAVPLLVLACMMAGSAFSLKRFVALSIALTLLTWAVFVILLGLQLPVLPSLAE